MFSAELRVKAEQLVARYPVARSALLPLLHLVQVQDGYISKDGIAECAELLSLTKAEVGAVATFYTMYKREPLGRHLVSVCTNFSCKVRGAQEVYDRLSEKLGVGHNETTPDGALTLEHAECLGNCEGAPVVSVDYLNYECLTPDAASELVDRLIAGEVPPPTRGLPSPGIRQMSHRLAGLGPMNGEADGMPSLVDTATAEPPVPDRDRGRGTPLHDGADKLLGGEGGQAEGAATPGRQEQQEEAQRQVADAGFQPEEVESESGYTAREMPTTDPDSEATLSTPTDPRRDDHEPDQPPGGEGGAQAPPRGGDRVGRDESRLLVDEDAAPEGIADTPQTEELGAKSPPDGADPGGGPPAGRDDEGTSDGG